jgi:hypothetical protein
VGWIQVQICHVQLKPLRFSGSQKLFLGPAKLQMLEGWVIDFFGVNNLQFSALSSPHWNNTGGFVKQGFDDVRLF